MLRHALPSTLFALLLAAAPALATWDALQGGRAEPSTPFDFPPFAWTGPNAAPVDRIYLNGNWIQGPGDGLSPALGKLRQFVAYFGYWRDCNLDGYIGDAASGTEEYSTLVASVDTTVCPVGSPYNTGRTVREFQWIGPGSAYVDDPAARVWVDWGAPGDPAAGVPKRAADDVLAFVPGKPRWEGSVPWLASASGNPLGGFATFHADLSIEAFAISGAPAVALPSGANDAFVYGAEQCPGSPTWDCDPAAWTTSVKVGDFYDLRDVDCFDALGPEGHC